MRCGRIGENGTQPFAQPQVRVRVGDGAGCHDLMAPKCLETATKIHCFRDTADKFWRICLQPSQKGAGEDERVTKEDQDFSAQETEAEVITLPCERFCKWWAEAKCNDQKKKVGGSFQKAWR